MKVRFKDLVSEKEIVIAKKGDKIQSQINEDLKSLKAKVEEAEMCKATINDSKEAAIKEINEVVDKEFKKHIGEDDFNTSIRGIYEMRLNEAIQNDQGLLNPALNPYLDASNTLKEKIFKNMRKCFNDGDFNKQIMHLVGALIQDNQQQKKPPPQQDPK